MWTISTKAQILDTRLNGIQTGVTSMYHTSVAVKEMTGTAQYDMHTSFTIKECVNHMIVHLMQQAKASQTELSIRWQAGCFTL